MYYLIDKKMDRAPPQSTPLLCTHSLQDSFLKLHCQSKQSPLVFASKRRNLICTPNMSPFNFQPVHLLELSDSDAPSIDVQDGQLILTASRGEERIRITAPLRQVLPQVAATTVKKPSPLKGLQLPGGDKRVGEDNGMAKLTEQAVREIRLMVSDAKFVKSFRTHHALCAEIAKAYNVHPATVKNVIDNVSWKHVKI
jgi:hypothetical protein